MKRRIKMTDKERFLRLRSYPNVAAGIISAKRYQEVNLTLKGVRLASHLENYKYNKVISELFSITEAGITYSNP